MKKGEDITVLLEGFAFEGKSVTRVDGMVVFVYGGVPGDKVVARITKVKKQFAEAEVVDVLSRSELRTEPRCQYFGTCGGCKWQHVDYKSQLEFKRQHVIDALERIGGFSGVTVHPPVGSEDLFFYRNKMEYSFGDKWITREELDRQKAFGEFPKEIDRFALGMHIPGRWDKVLDLEECFLQSETSYRIVNAVRAYCLEHRLSIYSTRTHTGYLRNLAIREGKHTGELMVNLVTSDDRPEIVQPLVDLLRVEFPSITTFVNNTTTRKSQVAFGEKERLYFGPGFITEKIGSRSYHISANSFFQTNTLQAERLYDTAMRMGRFEPDDIVFDLYSGTGSIALHIADKVKHVVCVENVESSVADARKNAEQNGVENCTFVLGDLKDRLTKDTDWLAHHPKPDVVIVDPPRAGMHDKVIKEIISIRPKRIVYVSCNPATQARDLKLLCEHSLYRVDEVQPVDMFPHTYHIETVASLSLVE